ncbi:interferon-like [Pogoniulus pusillus]|uniref:interferon-like n=1 Tax=Pogoniulus pusillus TaxID=488313 RepID=UPI0030B9A579
MAAPTTTQPCLRHSTPVLLLLLTVLATARACRHLHARDDAFPWDSLQLLQAMAPSPTQPCQLQQAPTLPSTLLHNSHPQQAPTIALRILQHLFAIFSSPSSPQHWDARARDELLNNLQHHIQRFQQCLSANSMLFQGRGPRNLLLSINKYFTSIQEFLYTHKHSTCAWDHVRLQARACFQQLHNLTRATRK